MANEAIKSVAGEIMSIAVEHGYEGPRGLSIAGAIDALADTLAGEDVDSGGGSIAEAVRAIAPYIGSGGGGTQYGENYANIGYSYVSPLSPDFNVNSAIPCDGAVLWDAVGNKPIALDAYGHPVIGVSLLDGTVASLTIDNAANDSGAVEAALFTYTSVDLETEIPTFDITSYDGVTYDSESHRFVIRIHDVTAPLFIEDNTPDGGVNAYPMIVFRVIEGGSDVPPLPEPI